MTAAGDRIKRFTVSDRVEHWFQLISFTVLGITGLIQRYTEAWISERLINVLGGIESVRNIHRVFATILMLAVVYHFGSILYRGYVRREPRAMLPGRADVTAIKGSIRYVFGRAAEPPPQGRFTWEEKVEYWAFIWGTVVMVITGYMLWNPIATASFLPGELIPAAKAVHGGEAVLAVLAIIVWHFYHVHIGHPNRSIFTGIMSRKEMEEIHPLELASIDAGDYSPPGGEELRRRVQRFAAGYGILAVMLLGAVYLFVTFEDTAIETITPPEQIEVFAPIETLAPGTATTTEAPTLPTTTVDPGSAGTDATWESDIAGILDPDCTVCHGANLQSAGLDLSSYSGALAGGESGASVVPGDAAGSPIVQIVEPGDHFAQLSDNDLAVLRGWIDAGAEEGDGAPTTDPGEIAWDSTIAGMFDPSCTGCHGAGLQSGGLDLSSYAAAVAGGGGGPGVVPGDAAASMIVQVLVAGGHPGQLSTEDLAVLIGWIDAGAAETGGGGATPPVAAGTSWDGAVAVVFDPSCTSCHGAALQSGGVDLSSYTAAVAVVVPGDSAGSVVVQVMEAGGHPVQLSAEDLALVKDWIDAGAAETDGGGAAPPVAAGTTWNGAVAGLFDASCTACHGANLQSGGLDLSSLSAVLAGGGRGAGVVPGDAAGSVIVQILEAGGHPAQLSAEDLDRLKEWIDAGASEG
ncbi:c-type cytochrome domain-containing protein [Actinomycetota bacterium]